MLKSLQRDILHEAESRDLKVIIISGTSLIALLRVLKTSLKILLLTGAVPQLMGELFGSSFTRTFIMKNYCVFGGLGPNTYFFSLLTLFFPNTVNWKL